MQYNLKQLVSINIVNINDDAGTSEIKKQQEYTTVLILDFSNNTTKRMYYIERDYAKETYDRIISIIGEKYFI